MNNTFKIGDIVKVVSLECNGVGKYPKDLLGEVGTIIYLNYDLGWKFPILVKFSNEKFDNKYLFEDNNIDWV